MKRTRLFLFLLCCAVPALLAAALSAEPPQPAPPQKVLAVFPFTGGSESDGEAIASSLVRQHIFRSAFDKTTPISRAISAAMGFEQRFRQNSGFTDADTIFELGKELNASHVVAGSITKLGDRNLVLISVLDVESLQQVAGAYETYGSIEEMDKHIPVMAKRLAAAVSRNTGRLPGLSVPPFTLLSGVDQSDAMVLAQILSCDLANGNTYAVLPRTDSIDKVLEERARQRGGAAETERAKRLGAGRSAKFVLAGSVERLGNSNKFGIDILNLEDGSYEDGTQSTLHANLSEGIPNIASIAVQLNATRAEREAAERAAERAKIAKAAAEKAAAEKAERDAERAEIAKAAAEKAAAEKAERDAARAAARRERDARREKAERELAAWRATARRLQAEILFCSIQWGQGDSMLLFHLPIVGNYRLSLTPFSYIDLGMLLGGMLGSVPYEESEEWEGYFSVSPAFGLKILSTESVELFASTVLEMGKFGPWSGLITGGITPGFDAGLTLFVGGDKTTFLNFKYRGLWFKEGYTHSVGIGIGIGWRQ